MALMDERELASQVIDDYASQRPLDCQWFW